MLINKLFKIEYAQKIILIYHVFKN